MELSVWVWRGILCLLGGMAIYIVFDLFNITIAVWGEGDDEKNKYED